MNVVIVVLFSLLLSFGAAVGVNIQKLSMTKEGGKEVGTQRPPYRQPLWCIGLLIIILDGCGDFVFIGLAPQSLLAPLGSLGVGWNIILAPIFNPTEKVTRSIVFATALIYVGTILTVLYATDSAPNYNLSNIIVLMSTFQFRVYSCFCIMFQGGMFYHGRKNGFGILHLCGLAGCFGGFCIILAKTTSELVKNVIITGVIKDWTSSPLPCMFIIGILVCVTTQMHYLNAALSKFDALLVVPIYQSFWNAFSITGGPIFFQEYNHMSEWDREMYALGIFITLTGVTLLVKQRRKNMLPLHSNQDDVVDVNKIHAQ